MAQVCPWGARRVTAEDLCIAAVSWGEVADGRLGAYWIHTSLGTARDGYREYTPLSSRDLFPGPIGAGARRCPTAFISQPAARTPTAVRTVRAMGPRNKSRDDSLGFGRCEPFPHVMCEYRRWPPGDQPGLARASAIRARSSCRLIAPGIRRSPMTKAGVPVIPIFSASA